jgi:hypothetical protein
MRLPDSTSFEINGIADPKTQSVRRGLSKCVGRERTWQVHGSRDLVIIEARFVEGLVICLQKFV